MLGRQFQAANGWRGASQVPDDRAELVSFGYPDPLGDRTGCAGQFATHPGRSQSRSGSGIARYGGISRPRMDSRDS